MYKKEIAIIDNDQVLKALVREMQDKVDIAKKEDEAIKKKRDDMLRETTEFSYNQFRKIEKRLEELKLFPPEYDQKIHRLSVEENGTISISEWQCR